MPDTNGSKRNGSGQFIQGSTGNPAGRPRGARNRLGEAFLEDMFAAWTDKGKAAIETVIAERPQDFLKVVASILPKEIAAEVTHRYVARMPEQPSTVEQWQEQHTPLRNQIQ